MAKYSIMFIEVMPVFTTYKLPDLAEVSLDLIHFVGKRLIIFLKKCGDPLGKDHVVFR